MGQLGCHGASLPGSPDPADYRDVFGAAPAGVAGPDPRSADGGRRRPLPSSLIFAGLVVLWLLILVPAVARHRQEVARPSVAALSGRVLARSPQWRRTLEVDVVHETDEPRPTATRPPARYRPGRGGFDPEAAALTARARYAFRQRVVLGLLVTAAVTAVVALVISPTVWWLQVAVDLVLVGYLVYLRRQVRVEEAIRERRAARMAGTRRPPATEDPELDDGAQRGGQVASDRDPGPVGDPWDEEAIDGDSADRASRTGPPPVPPRPQAGAGADAVVDDQAEPALPRLRPVPPPPLPAGTTLVQADDEDPELHDLDGPSRPDYRRTAGD